MRQLPVRLLIVLVLLLPHSPLAAQVLSGDWYAGGAVGLDGLTSAYVDGCEAGVIDRSMMAAAGGNLRVGRGLARGLALEASLGHTVVPAVTCTLAPRAHPDGVHVDRYPTNDYAGTLMAPDLRLRLQPGRHWLVSAGAGYLPHFGDPFAVGGLGLRFGRYIAGAIDAEVRVHRVGVVDRSQEWSGGRVVRLVSEEPGQLWRTGVSIRAGIEARLN